MTESPKIAETARSATRRGLRYVRRRVLELPTIWKIRILLRILPDETTRLLVATILLGVLSGLVAVLFHVTLEVIGKASLETVASAPRWMRPLIMIALPALSAWIAGLLLVRSGLPAGGSGIPQVKAVLSGTLKPFGLAVGGLKFVLCSIQIGGGASLGREGPTVQICASLSRSVLSLFALPRSLIRRFLPVSAAAGIAAAFNTPIAAVAFVLEEMLARSSPTAMTGLVVAAAIAAIEERMLLGADPMFHVPSWEFGGIQSLPSFLLLGVIAGYLGVGFHNGLISLRAWFMGEKRLSRPAKMALGGLIAGIATWVAFAAFERRGIAGPGYALLNDALHDNLSMLESASLLPLKFAATIASYSSGGVGGIFTPVLALGSLLGEVVGQIQIHLPWADTTPVGAFALVGMGALFAAVIRAPMTSVLILIELTGNYGLILPLMLANMTAFLVARSKVAQPIYEALMAQDGMLPDEPEADTQAVVGSLMQPTPERIASGTLLKDARELVAANECLGVDLPDGRCAGLLLRKDIHPSPWEDDTPVQDLLKIRTNLRVKDPALPALSLMARSDLSMLPVVDPQGALVGVFGSRNALVRMSDDLPPAAPI